MSRFYRINAFILNDEHGPLPHSGGPAGVVLLPPSPLPSPLPPIDVGSLPGYPTVDWLRATAAELALSTTAFVLPLSADEDGLQRSYAIRWFTPAGVELPLCGHATLAAAHALLARGALDTTVNSAILHSRSGPLPVRCAGPSSSSEAPLLEMSFPGDPPRARVDCEAAARLLRLPEGGGASGLAECLGLPEDALQPCGLLAEALPQEAAASLAPPGCGVLYIASSRSGEDLLVELPRALLARVRPDTAAMQRRLAPATRILTLTARGAGGGDCGADIVSRVFFPRAAFEDPVCGAAHVQLAAYWTSRLGTRRLLARQDSPRGGELQLEVAQEGAEEGALPRVTLAGRCYLSVEGELVGGGCRPGQ